MAWKVDYTDKALDELERLDPVVQSRIVDYLHDVAASGNPRSRGHGLTAGLSGYWRYRIGDYRAICELLNGELVILAVTVGHRSRVYDK